MQLNKRERSYITLLLKNKYGQILSTAQDLEDDARKAFFEYMSGEWNLLLDLLSQFEQELSKSEIKAIYHNKA